MLRPMGEVIKLIWCAVIEVFRSRASLEAEILALHRELICAMSLANPLWGAPRIHGELLKLGIDVGQTWQGTGNLHLKAGRRSSATRPMGLHRWICLLFRRSRFGYSMAC
jgi:hypothetical protein